MPNRRHRNSGLPEIRGRPQRHVGRSHLQQRKRRNRRAGHRGGSGRPIWPPLGIARPDTGGAGSGCGPTATPAARADKDPPAVPSTGLSAIAAAATKIRSRRGRRNIGGSFQSSSRMTKPDPANRSRHFSVAQARARMIVRLAEGARRGRPCSPIRPHGIGRSGEPATSFVVSICLCPRCVATTRRHWPCGALQVGQSDAAAVRLLHRALFSVPPELRHQHGALDKHEFASAKAALLKRG